MTASQRKTTGAAGVVVGVDGGNSKTQVLVATRDGTIIGSSHVHGRADIYQAASPEAALDLVMGAVSDALASAQARNIDVAASAFSMAGADWPEDIDFLTAEFGARGRHGSVTVVNDAIGALWADLPDGPGVVVACGTGAATGARGPLGEWHSSYWQGPQGAHDLAQQALQAAYRSSLGIEPASSLVGRLPAALEMADLAAVLHARTARGVPRPRIDGLASVVLDEAARGDVVARQIVRSHGRELADYALAAARKVGIDASDSFGLVLTGGVFRHQGRELRDAVVPRVRHGAPNVVVRKSAHPPVVGALRLAFREIAIADPAVDTQIERTAKAAFQQAAPDHEPGR